MEKDDHGDSAGASTDAPTDEDYVGIEFVSPDFIGGAIPWGDGADDPDDPCPNHPVAKALRRLLADINGVADSYKAIAETAARHQEDSGQRYEELQEASANEPPVISLLSGRHQMPLSKQTRYIRGRRAFEGARSLDRNLPRYFLLGLVSHYDAFVDRLIRGLFQIRPDLRRGIKPVLTMEELLRVKSLEEASNLLLERDIEDAVRGSHLQQLQWFEQRLGFKTLREFDSLPEFVEITERRNLIAHNDGVVTNRYLNKCKEAGTSLPDLRPGDSLPVDEDYLRSAYCVLFEVGVRLAQVTWRKVRKDELESSDYVLTRICYALLVLEDFELARILLQFALALPKHSSEHERRIFVVNLAQSNKWLGAEAKCQQVLAAEDWTATEDAFALALHVLHDDFKEAARTMTSLAASGDIGRAGFHDWPLFREFRKTEEFADAYRAAYGDQFVAGA